MSSNSRRKLLLSIAASGSSIFVGKSLPNSWVKPVVESMVLPAHAQTSGGNSMFFLGSCDSAPSDQFYTVQYSSNPATLASTFSIISHGDTDPGNPTGSNQVFFANHNSGPLRVILRVSDGSFISLHNNDCDVPAQSNSVESRVIFLTTLDLEYTVEHAGVAGAPTITITPNNII